MSRRYMVKWASIGEFSHKGYEYGTVAFNQDEYDLKPGELAITHDIMPHIVTIQESRLIDVDSKEYYAVSNEMYKQAVKESLRLPEGVLCKGKMFNVHVADGYATYIITRANKKTCHVEWRGYGNPDGYTDNILGYGMKSVPRDRIEHQVLWFERMQRHHNENNDPV